MAEPAQFHPAAVSGSFPKMTHVARKLDDDAGQHASGRTAHGTTAGRYDPSGQDFGGRAPDEQRTNNQSRAAVPKSGAADRRDIQAGRCSHPRQCFADRGASSERKLNEGERRRFHKSAAADRVSDRPPLLTRSVGLVGLSDEHERGAYGESRGLRGWHSTANSAAADWLRGQKASRPQLLTLSF
jgi:hypothetical protein